VSQCALSAKIERGGGSGGESRGESGWRVTEEGGGKEWGI